MFPQNANIYFGGFRNNVHGILALESGQIGLYSRQDTKLGLFFMKYLLSAHTGLRNGLYFVSFRLVLQQILLVLWGIATILLMKLKEQV